MKKKKNAFTLIELLAIIVILAIIAVITVPIILNIIENSRKGAVQDSAYGYKDAVNKYYVTELSKPANQNMKLDGDYIISEGNLTGKFEGTTSQQKTLQIPVSGDKPSNGKLRYNNNVLGAGCLAIGDYQVIFVSGSVDQTAKGNCSTYEFPTSGSETSQNEVGNNNGEGSQIPSAKAWSHYKYIIVNEENGDSFGESDAFYSGWDTWTQENNEGDAEVCGKFNDVTICAEPGHYDDTVTCSEGTCIATGYLATLKEASESNNLLSCASSDTNVLYCSLDGHYSNPYLKYDLNEKYVEFSSTSGSYCTINSSSIYCGY